MFLPCFSNIDIAISRLVQALQVFLAGEIHDDDHESARERVLVLLQIPLCKNSMPGRKYPQILPLGEIWGKYCIPNIFQNFRDTTFPGADVLFASETPKPVDLTASWPPSRTNEAQSSRLSEVKSSTPTRLTQAYLARRLWLNHGQCRCTQRVI